jgi:hypothetical protein
MLRNTRRLLLLFMLLLGAVVGLIQPVQAQDGQSGIEAPETYDVDLINISREELSQFDVTFEFEGVNHRGEAVSLSLSNVVAIRPDPAAFHAINRAEGSLDLFRLGGEETDMGTLESELTYLGSALVTHIALPDAGSESCGKLTGGRRPAINQLDSLIPFPTEIFILGSVPEMPRLLPDAEFDGQPVARYGLESISNRTISSGSVEAHILPDTNRLTYFAFEGEGEFLARELPVEGTLRYRYRLLPPDPNYAFDRPAGCQVPAVDGVRLFEPSVEWITRDNFGTYLTAQSISNLVAFHEEQLAEAGFEQVNAPLVGSSFASMSYLAPDGDFVNIDLIDALDGTRVNVTIEP